MLVRLSDVAATEVLLFVLKKNSKARLWWLCVVTLSADLWVCLSASITHVCVAVLVFRLDLLL